MVDSLDPLSSPLVVLSDLHLRSLIDSNGQTFIAFLKKISGRNIEVLALLGDVFEFCHGGMSYFRKKNQALADELTRISREGARVVFIEGNHEFRMDASNWPGVEICSGHDMTIVLGNGERIGLAHGDLLLADKTYRRFRAAIKSRTLTGVARALPGRVFEKFCFSVADLSRSRDVVRRLDHAAVLTAADNWLDRVGAKHGIFGHFHVPYAEARPRVDGRIVSLDCWDHPNFLVYGRDGIFYRGFLAPGAAITVAAARPLF